MTQITTKIRRGMKYDYREWDLVADTAWLTFFGDITYLNKSGEAFIGIMGRGDSKLKELQFNIRGEDEWTYYEFYDLEMSTVDGTTYMKFINTVKRTELELKATKFREPRRG